MLEFRWGGTDEEYADRFGEYPSRRMRRLEVRWTPGDNMAVSSHSHMSPSPWLPVRNAENQDVWVAVVEQIGDR